MHLYIGQVLNCNNGEEVIVRNVTKENITIEYKGKTYQRPISIVGKELFLKDIDKAGKKQDYIQRRRRLSSYSRGTAPYINEYFEERAEEERRRRGK